MKQLITVSNVSVAPSEATPKPINTTQSKNDKVKPLSSTKMELSGKQQKLKQSSTANTQEPADRLQPLETTFSIPAPANSAIPKSEVFSQPKPQAVAEPAITQKPVKQKAIAAAVSKTSAAQQSSYYLVLC